MNRLLAIPASLLIGIFFAVLARMPFAAPLMLLALPLLVLVFPASLFGLYFSLAKEKPVAMKIGLFVIHLGGIAAACYFVDGFWMIGNFPRQR